MNTRTLSIIGLVILGIVLFLGGMFFGQSQASAAAFYPENMMFANNSDAQVDGYNMMGNFGMMDGGFDMMGNGFGMMGGGMMGGYGFGGLADVDPLSIEDAVTALDEYLAALGNDDLTLGEVMIFDNHAYAQILDKSRDSGVFEVLVDPVSRNVFPEPGPNMMWNTEYSPMSGFGDYSMMGSMMGNGMMGGTPSDTEISVTGEEAIDIAQQYLDTYLPGTTADETADPFPGYYTIHVLRDSETSGMLSVNAYTGQVFLHHWHGAFVEMAGEVHD
ncbi:MAG: hypothetical protein WA996_25265 [Candidatus Promineifilaceae bacterium]